MPFSDPVRTREIYRRLYKIPDLESIARTIGANLSDDDEFLICANLERELRIPAEQRARSEAFTKIIQFTREFEQSFDPEDENGFPPGLRSAMDALGLTELDCARLFDVSVPSIRRWINEETIPILAMRNVIKRSVLEEARRQWKEMSGFRE